LADMEPREELRAILYPWPLCFTEKNDVTDTGFRRL